MIEAIGLTKYYGDFAALQDVSFKVAPGEVLGLLGLNGAGKTTYIRLLTGYLVPTEGETRIAGQSILSDPMGVKTKLGYLPEQPPLYPELTVEDYLRFVARLRGIPEQDFGEEFLRVLDVAQLSPARQSLIRNLSLGYRKRVGIAQAIIGSPEVLIFDEPVSGLDPRQIVEIRKLIRSLAGKHTILVSSHILTEVSRTCDRVLIIHNGKVAGELAGENMANLEDRFMELTGSPVAGVGQ